MEIELTQHANYQATIELNAMEAFFSNKVVETKLKEYGFTEVVVQGSGKKREAAGIWSKATTAKFQLPKNILSIKRI